MSDNYNLKFEKLCTDLELGEIIGNPEAVSGGLLHKMYAVETNKGKYAVKALNPQIMGRSRAMQNFIRSEQIVSIAANNIPALPAKRYNDHSIQEIDKQYYLVFEWIEGERLNHNQITYEHCEIMGTILAKLHLSDFSELGIARNGLERTMLTNWSGYLQKGRQNNSVWVNLLVETMDQLYDWNAQAIQSAKILASNQVISHRDMEPKNVMWIDGSPLIIDWESAGYTNPMQDLVETALYWSRTGNGSLDKEGCLTFISGYRKCRELLK